MLIIQYCASQTVDSSVGYGRVPLGHLHNPRLDALWPGSPTRLVAWKTVIWHDNRRNIPSTMGPAPANSVHRQLSSGAYARQTDRCVLWARQGLIHQFHLLDFIASDPTVIQRVTSGSRCRLNQALIHVGACRYVRAGQGQCRDHHIQRFQTGQTTSHVCF